MLKSAKYLSFFFIGVVIFFISCQKDISVPISKVINDTVKIIIHDTIRIHDTIAVIPFNRLQLLTKKAWLADQVERSIVGTNSEYIRNGTNTTGVTYENIRIKFNADGTGTYTDENSMASSLNWTFSTADERNVIVKIGPPNSAVFIWNLVELKDNYLHCVTPYNGNSLYAARYIQVPL